MKLTRIMTVNEVSEYLRVHPTTIYRLLDSQQLPGFRVGSDWRVDRETIDRWCLLGRESAAAPKKRK